MSFGGRGRGRGGRPPESGGLLLLRRSAEECGLDSRNIRSLGDSTRPSLYPDIELPCLSAATGDQSATSNSATGNTAPTKRHSAQTIYLIAKSREIHHRITNSVFYVRPTKDVPDVLRYSDLIHNGNTNNNSKRQRLLAKTVDSKLQENSDANFVLAHCLGGQQETVMGRFVPEELVTSGQQKVLARRALKNAAAAKLLGSAAADDDAAAWEDQFGPDDDHGDDEGTPNRAATARQRSDSTGSAMQNEQIAAAAEDDFDEQSEQEEEEEAEDYVVNYYESGEEDGDDDGGEGEQEF